jgi:hypothetical protein
VEVLLPMTSFVKDRFATPDSAKSKTVLNEQFDEAAFQNLQKSTGKKIFYRFYAPSDQTYPDMLELFSSKPEGFDLAPESLLTPISFDHETSSLSAILLDKDYYPFIQMGRKIVGGLPVLGAKYLIPLKAKAFLDLSKRREQGEEVDSKNIKKHRNDVFRLFPLLTGDTNIKLPATISDDMRDFIKTVSTEKIDLKPFGVQSLTIDSLFENLRKIYNL